MMEVYFNIGYNRKAVKEDSDLSLRLTSMFNLLLFYPLLFHKEQCLKITGMERGASICPSINKQFSLILYRIWLHKLRLT